MLEALPTSMGKSTSIYCNSNFHTPSEHKVNNWPY